MAGGPGSDIIIRRNNNDVTSWTPQRVQEFLITQDDMNQCMYWGIAIPYKHLMIAIQQDKY